MKIKIFDSKKLFIEYWLWSPFHTWKGYKLYWNFAELINFVVFFVPSELISIEIWLPCGKLMFHWTSNNYNTGAPTLIDFILFRQRKKTSEILEDWGFQKVDSTDNLTLYGG
jgi:hypothetical protein